MTHSRAFHPEGRLLMRYRKASLQTALVRDSLKYGVLAPDDNPGGLPLLFLLHGGGGDRRMLENQVALIEAAVAQGVIEPLVVVTPSVGMSYYMDSIDGDERWETAIMTVLTDQVAQDYGVDTDRQVIAGVSMGGVGSLRLAFRHPGRFVAVAALEAGVDPFLRLADQPAWYAHSEDARIGDKFGVPVDEAYWRSLNPASIAADDPDRLKASGLRIFIEVGTHDGLFNHHNVEFLHRVLFDHGIKHEYRTILGADHIGASLPGRITEALRFLGNSLVPEVPDEAAEEFRAAIRRNYEARGITPPD